MATTVTAIETLTVDLEAKPGALSAVCAAFRDAKVNLRACWAFEMGPGMPAKGVFHAQDAAKAEAVLRKLGKSPKRGAACRAEGDDAVGAYAELLKRIADAGVNLHATDAFGVGGKFAAMFFAEERDAERLCKALGCALAEKTAAS